MTTPTSFSLSSQFSVGNILVFANTIDSSALQLSETSTNLLGFSTSGVSMTEGTIGYLLGSFEPNTNVFTVGAGSQTLIWAGTTEQFSSVGRTGGNWQLGT